MNLAYSQAQAAASSVPSFLDIPQSDTVSGTITASESLPPESVTESCPTPLSSAISKHSSVTGTPQAMRGWLMSLPPVSLASRSVSPESKKEPTTSGICGRQRQSALELCAPDSFCLKTCRESVPTCPWLLETCADLGMKFQDPSSLGLTMLGRRTEGNGCGYLPTAQQRDYRSPDLPGSVNYERKAAKGWTIDLNSKIALLPTPRKCMTGDISEERKADRFNNLETVLSRELLPTLSVTTTGGPTGLCGGSGNRKKFNRMWGQLPTPRAEKHTPQSRADFTPNLAARIQELAPTPSASMVTMQDFVQAKYHSSKRPKYSEVMLPTPNMMDGGSKETHRGEGTRLKLLGAVSGQSRGLKLQPAFVEYMMNWPEGWTALEPLPLESMEKWLSGTTWDEPWPDAAQRLCQAGNVSDRVNRLKALGNGQVSVVVATAWRILTQ